MPDGAVRPYREGMEDFGRYLNVVDIEATCWATAPPAGQVSEIIEIGLCVVDIFSFERVARHRLLVRPRRSTVSPFCTQLTGLAPQEVSGGLSFRDACLALERRHRTSSRSWASWGDYDRRQFGQQCRTEGVPFPFSSRHINAKKAFSQMFHLDRKLGLQEALTHAGLPLEGRHHCGEDDAWNVGALAELLLRHGMSPT